MIKNKKVAYTLSPDVINLIDQKSALEKKTKSEYLADCIKRGYGTMLEDYEEQENEGKPLNCPIKRRKNTIRKTFSLPIDIVDELNWFSKKLGMKKSHLIHFCVMNYERPKSNLDQIDKIMEDFANFLNIPHGISIR